jgi:hypothetical protein
MLRPKPLETAQQAYLNHRPILRMPFQSQEEPILMGESKKLYISQIFSSKSLNPKKIMIRMCNAPKSLGLDSSIFLHKVAKIHKVY